ncbi:isoprenylcysteine carboxylmethyltransferase family protein (plasmid) [Halorussus salilacus]|uniref:methyltransferase family protein n=1 Tax=Halorussus salilacus TaxID=2953750 RepID=UPI0020A091A3|nr:isoprenylcysteine carboxylmethyltransferase family protein [Halorussus salilacus]USZ70114.1 isoprenylcysteine carboxylmethyltransferase family protein [Halorussus salilacus]
MTATTGVKTLFFGVGLVAGATLVVGLLISIRSPTWRFWPHGERDWTLLIGWAAWLLYFGGLLGVVYLDWWNWYRPPTLVQGISLLLMLAGAVLATWAVWRLGVWESSGLEGRLNTEGPYRYSRNPQYVGYVAMLGGGAVLAGSWMATVIALVGIVWFLLAPLAEEPWLREQYGDAYEEYRRSVPRFLGRRHLEPSQQDQTDRSKGGNL